METKLKKSNFQEISGIFPDLLTLKVLPQNIPLLWQLINHKHIAYIPELLRYHTIIMVNFN